MNLINGQFQDSISIHNRALHYGDGLFETMLVVDKQLRHWPLHFSRLKAGCHKLNIPTPDKALLEDDLSQLTLLQTESRFILKIIISRGYSGRGYGYQSGIVPDRMVLAFDAPRYSERSYQTGINAIICKTPLARNQSLAGIKHLNRLEQVLARAEWQDDNIFEGLMLDTEGCVIEGTMSNVFFIHGEKLITPDLQDCGITGVMREHILNLAARQGIKCEITKITKAQLVEFDGMFFCNSVMNIMPVTSLDGHRYHIPEMIKFLQVSAKA